MASYNIYVGSRDLQQTASVIREMNADIVALQEVVPESAAFLADAFSHDYPYRYFSTGLGLMSRLPLKGARFERSLRGINGFMFAEALHHDRQVQIANLHLDPLHLWTLADLATLPFQFRRQRHIQRDELAQALKNIQTGKPTILIGDFNRVGDHAIDQLKARGFVDSFAETDANPDTTFTLHFHLLGIHFGRRIDFIFHDFHFRTLGSVVVPGEPSDHDALISHLRWRTAVPNQKRERMRPTCRQGTHPHVQPCRCGRTRS
ncbi:hypothetical protein BGE01nite_02230 [Brevifollis gellanilyticus]|uniref:Endonuclease/exonuclease/phosphatase domain-containing protein n=1 Tax=Brevifollis gellanilyticus TaxID=748831 RepID=A0A512M2G4_9BACT|nr:hypothetical protein BGE01nite_02230 [Brevifollis gellanilyticus]